MSGWDDYAYGMTGLVDLTGGEVCDRLIDSIDATFHDIFDEIETEAELDLE